MIHGYLQIQCNLYQNVNSFFHRNGKADPQIHMELQGALDSQNNLEKEE